MKNAPVRLVLLLAAPLACSSDGLDTTELTDEALMLDEDDVGAGVEDDDLAVEASGTPASEIGELDQRLLANENQRICSVISRGDNDLWYDDVVVNNTWTEANCDAWAAAIGGTSGRLGCLTPNSHWYGSPLPFGC